MKLTKLKIRIWLKQIYFMNLKKIGIKNKKKWNSFHKKSKKIKSFMVKNIHKILIIFTNENYKLEFIIILFIKIYKFNIIFK